MNEIFQLHEHAQKLTHHYFITTINQFKFFSHFFRFQPMESKIKQRAEHFPEIVTHNNKNFAIYSQSTTSFKPNSRNFFLCLAFNNAIWTILFATNTVLNSGNGQISYKIPPKFSTLVAKCPSVGMRQTTKKRIHTYMHTWSEHNAKKL